MKRLFFAIFGLMLVLIVVSSFLVLRIRVLEYSVNKLHKSIQENQENLQNLKAEWSYLNNPKYLRMMAKKYAKTMRPIIGNDNMSVMKIPLKPDSIHENNRN